MLHKLKHRRRRTWKERFHAFMQKGGREACILIACEAALLGIELLVSSFHQTWFFNAFVVEKFVNRLTERIG
jgi:hypothetical protein